MKYSHTFKSRIILTLIFLLITLPINNINAAIISGNNTGSLSEDVDPDNNNLLETSGRLSVTDSDEGEAFFVDEEIYSNVGRLNLFRSGYWYYSADNTQSVIQNLAHGQTLTDSLTISSIDGTMQNIVITIHGANEAQHTNGISLSWVAPAMREDNSPLSLSKIAGYIIYYGTAPEDYTKSVRINDSSATTHTIENISTGTYYFVITTVDTEGRESLYTPEIIKTL